MNDKNDAAAEILRDGLGIIREVVHRRPLTLGEACALLAAVETVAGTHAAQMEMIAYLGEVFKLGMFREEPLTPEQEKQAVMDTMFQAIVEEVDGDE